MIMLHVKVSCWTGSYLFSFNLFNSLSILKWNAFSKLVKSLEKVVCKEITDQVLKSYT